VTLVDSILQSQYTLHLRDEIKLHLCDGKAKCTSVTKTAVTKTAVTKTAVTKADCTSVDYPNKRTMN